MWGWDLSFACSEETAPTYVTFVCVTLSPKAQQASWEQNLPCTSLERHPEGGQVLFSKCGWRRLPYDAHSLPSSSSNWTDVRWGVYFFISVNLTETHPCVCGHSFLPQFLQPFHCHHLRVLWPSATSFSSKLFRITSECREEWTQVPSPHHVDFLLLSWKDGSRSLYFTFGVF